MFRITQTQDALGGIAQFSYDSNSNTTCVTNQLGSKEAYSYDSMGNVTKHIDGNNTTSSCTLKSGGKQTTFTYTSKNDLATVTSPLGIVTSNSYDSKGNLTQAQVKDAPGAVVAETCSTVDSHGRSLRKSWKSPTSARPVPRPPRETRPSIATTASA